MFANKQDLPGALTSEEIRQVPDYVNARLMIVIEHPMGTVSSLT